MEQPPSEKGKVTQISYEDLEKAYHQASQGFAEPSFVVTTMSRVRDLYGDEQVDKWIEDGTIRVMDEEFMSLDLEDSQ